MISVGQGAKNILNWIFRLKVPHNITVKVLTKAVVSSEVLTQKECSSKLSHGCCQDLIVNYYIKSLSFSLAVGQRLLHRKAYNMASAFIRVERERTRWKPQSFIT